MTDEQNLLDRVIRIVADKLNVSADQITADSTFADDLGADSLDVVELLMALEDEFQLTIEEDEAENIEAVRDVVRYIQDHL
jgi:acyl carrier protein